MKGSVASLVAVAVSFTVVAHATPPLPPATATSPTLGVAATGLRPTLVSITKPQAPSAAFQVHRAASNATQAARSLKAARITEAQAADGTKTVTFNAAPCSGGGTMTGTFVTKGMPMFTNGSTLSGDGTSTLTMTYVKCTNGGTTMDGGPFTTSVASHTSATDGSVTGMLGFRGNLTTSSSSGVVQITNAAVGFQQTWGNGSYSWIGEGTITINGQTMTFDGDRVTIGTTTMFF